MNELFLLAPKSALIIKIFMASTVVSVIHVYFLQFADASKPIPYPANDR
jgi:hypothetical protein